MFFFYLEEWNKTNQSINQSINHSISRKLPHYYVKPYVKVLPRHYIRQVIIRRSRDGQGWRDNKQLCDALAHGGLTGGDFIRVQLVGCDGEASPPSPPPPPQSPFFAAWFPPLSLNWFPSSHYPTFYPVKCFLDFDFPNSFLHIDLRCSTFCDLSFAFFRPNC